MLIDTSQGNPQDDSHAEEEEPDLDLNPDDDVFDRSHESDINGEDVHSNVRPRDGAAVVGFANSSVNNNKSAFVATDFRRNNEAALRNDEGEPLLYRAGLGEAWLALDQPVDSNVSSISSSVRSSDCYSDGHDAANTSVPPSLRFDDGDVTPRCDSYLQSQDLPPPSDGVRLDSYCDQSDDEGAGFTAEEDDDWSESNDTATLPLHRVADHGVLTVEV